MRLRFALLFLAGCGGGTDWSAPTGPMVHVAGQASVFSDPGGLSLTGAVITMTEAPENTTTVAADGTFAFDVPSGGPATFSMTQAGFHDNQTGTIDIGSSGVADVGFQAPTDMTFNTLATALDVTPDPADCQIATTVSRAGTAPFGGDGLGETDAVVSIDPSLPAAQGPIYFGYTNGVIYPDTTLHATSLDGGVVFTNVPPGDYTLTATKSGVDFTTVDIRCRAGVLVNAAPPHGLQGL